VSRLDGADRLLALVVRLLPAGRRDWGRAMRAESTAIKPARERWAFALGCLRVVLAQPAVLRAVGYPLLAVAILVAVLRWSTGIGYAPLRWGVVGTVALLLGLAWWARRPGVLGPVADGWAPRAVRAGGCLLVGAITAGFASSVGTHGPPEDAARFGVPIFAVLLSSYLVGFLALTARRTATAGRTLATGVGAPVAAAAVWLAVQVGFPPLPTNVGGSLFAMGLAAAVVVVLAGAPQYGAPRDAALAALCVGTLGPLLVFADVVLLSSYGPAWLIPDLVPMALSPADDVANSRIEIQDPYVVMLFLAALSAVLLSVVSIAGRRGRILHTEPEDLTAPEPAATA
jgi:hypothetical protein